MRLVVDKRTRKTYSGDSFITWLSLVGDEKMLGPEDTFFSDGSHENMVPPRPLRASRETIEKYAEVIARNCLELSYGDDIQHAVIKAGGKIVIGSTGENTSNSGSLIARSRNDFTIYLSPFTSLLRDRFTIAHELGHLFLHLENSREGNPSASMYATRYVDEKNEEAMRAEWEANWFAAALLMPATKFAEVYKINGDDLTKTADFFKVSSAAASVRANSLGLLKS